MLQIPWLSYTSFIFFSMRYSNVLLQDDEDGNSWVLNSKQGFQDCEIYAKLEEWLGRKVDEYWDTHFDNLELVWVMVILF